MAQVRHWGFVSLLASVVWLLVSLTQTQEVYAEGKKISGTGGSVAIVSETKMFPGDKPEHELTLATIQEVDYSSDPDFNNVQVTAIGFSDYVAGNGNHWGHRVITHPNGDKTSMSYEGTTKTMMKSDGPPETTFEGKWRYTGGTGKFKGIIGGGTYKGELVEEGSKYEWEGEYEIK